MCVNASGLDEGSFGLGLRQFYNASQESLTRSHNDSFITAGSWAEKVALKKGDDTVGKVHALRLC